MNTFILLRIVVVVYVLAINLYSFLLLKAQKQEMENGEKVTRDLKLYVIALLGGGIGIYVGMFCLKFRLKNFFLMVLIPILITLTVYICVITFINDFGFQLNI